MSARDREWAENKEEAIWSGLKDKNLDILTDVYRVLEKVKVKMTIKTPISIYRKQRQKDELIQAIVGSLQVLFKRIGWVARKDHLYLSGSACGLQ